MLQCQNWLLPPWFSCLGFLFGFGILFSLFFFPAWRFILSARYHILSLLQNFWIFHRHRLQIIEYSFTWIKRKQLAPSENFQCFLYYLAAVNVLFSSLSVMERWHSIFLSTIPLNISRESLDQVNQAVIWRCW